MTTKRTKPESAPEPEAAPVSGFQLVPSEPRPEPEGTGKPWGGAAGGEPVEAAPDPAPAPQPVAPDPAPEGTLT